MVGGVVSFLGGLIQTASGTPLSSVEVPRSVATCCSAGRSAGGSALTHHPHVHGIVPGGGLALDADRWVLCYTNSARNVRNFRCDCTYRYRLAGIPDDAGAPYNGGSSNWQGAGTIGDAIAKAPNSIPSTWGQPFVEPLDNARPLWRRLRVSRDGPELADSASSGQSRKLEGFILLPTQFIQFSLRPLTRLNSLTLLVTSATPRLRACAAISRSFAPMSWPRFFRSARISA